MRNYRNAILNKSLRIFTTVLILFNISLAVFAQQPELKLTADEQQQVVDSIALFMTNHYVFADKGKEMSEVVRKNLNDGVYTTLTDPIAFAGRLTADLLTVNNDRHIGVRFMPDQIATLKADIANKDDMVLSETQKKQAAQMNYHFKEVKILPGNIGYLKFNMFMEASLAGPTAIAAMNFLANTDALIIDLTQNGGGSPTLIQLITSYFFEEPTHLNSFYLREGDRIDQFWTLPYVPGSKMTATDLYVLTSSNTFSGAEEFSYNLKNLERATLVGETTGGGAHPVDAHVINGHFAIFIPFARAVNPITQTNWEGTGVEPDVKTEAGKAFDKAYLMALEKLAEKEQDEGRKHLLSWTLEGMKAKQNPVMIDEKMMKQYAGVYGPRTIQVENGELWYQRENRPRMKMIPMSADTFMFGELEYFRLKFIRQEDKVTALEGHYDNGTVDRNDKS
jgi:retinol-binding protein 3